MIINGTNLQTLFVGFNAAFQNGLGMAPPDWEKIATRLQSSTALNEYGWLGQLPNIREWLGDRVVHQIAAHGYAIRNKDFELTIEVKKPDIEDDNLGIYAPLFSELGRSVAAHPNQLVFALLAAGFTTACYDGQYFFDTDHPVLDANGAPTTASNHGGGAGTPWFLLDTSRALKPLLYQVRKDFQLVRQDRPEDEVVFSRKAFRYGVDGRSNVGFGFWQFAFGSKVTLDASGYAAARAAMMGLKGDYARPLGLMPNLLVVPPSLEGAARQLLMAEQISGTDNPWKGTAQLLVTPWLA